MEFTYAVLTVIATLLTILGINSKIWEKIRGFLKYVFSYRKTKSDTEVQSQKLRSSEVIDDTDLEALERQIRVLGSSREHYRKRLIAAKTYKPGFKLSNKFIGEALELINKAAILLGERNDTASLLMAKINRLRSEIEDIERIAREVILYYESDRKMREKREKELEKKYRALSEGFNTIIPCLSKLFEYDWFQDHERFRSRRSS